MYGNGPAQLGRGLCIYKPRAALISKLKYLLKWHLGALAACTCMYKFSIVHACASYLESIIKDAGTEHRPARGMVNQMCVSVHVYDCIDTDRAIDGLFMVECALSIAHAGVLVIL